VRHCRRLVVPYRVRTRLSHPCRQRFGRGRLRGRRAEATPVIVAKPL
jgi:hypothetical protein